MNSLLEEHLDFSLGSKLPPTITKENTQGIENVIRQRILDELFDDPVRIMDKSGKRNINENPFDFIKSKKGLGELYEDDFKTKLLEQDPNAYL
jgi:U3 small nucleolar RNA-associated protein MPP10